MELWPVAIHAELKLQHTKTVKKYVIWVRFATPGLGKDRLTSVTWNVGMVIQQYIPPTFIAGSRTVDLMFKETLIFTEELLAVSHIFSRNKRITSCHNCPFLKNIWVIYLETNIIDTLSPEWWVRRCGKNLQEVKKCNGNWLHQFLQLNSSIVNLGVEPRVIMLLDWPHCSPCRTLFWQN